MIRRYEDLLAYQRAYKSSLELHKQSLSFPKHETHELGSQLRRSTKSITMNIAEGYGKKEYSLGEYKRFLFMSIGSVNEIMTLADICTDVGYMPKEFQTAVQKRYEEIRNMLFGIANKL